MSTDKDSLIKTLRRVQAIRAHPRKSAAKKKRIPSSNTLKNFTFLIFNFTFLCLGTVNAVDKSGVSPNTVSLPSGPGSIEGLGEAFQPTLNTGTAKYGLSLALPPNAGGMTPALALNYEGGNGNGVLGIGWGLSLIHI